MDTTEGATSTVTCSVCGQVNPLTALFCSRCTSPVALVPLHALTDDDQRTCLAALFQMLGQQLVTPSNEETLIDHDLWSAYLSAFWLRPETALILYAEAMAVAQVEDAGRPWLDLGCGDGIHAALCSGWRFDETFDAFQSLDLTAADIYNHFDGADFLATTTREGERIDRGIDIKFPAVARARALGVFDRVQQADATHLPLPDRCLQTIYSNMLRDLGAPLGRALDECWRVLRDDGVLLISAMTPAYPRHLYFAPLAREAEARGDHATAANMLRLDRGRSVFCQRQLSPQQWDALLRQHNLGVREAIPMVGPDVIRFWDVGLRPFTTALLHERQRWQREGALRSIKQSAVRMLDHALTPILQRLNEGEPCMNLLVVTKA